MQHSVLPLRKIRATIRHFPGHGYPHLEQVAKKVGIPQRTLQRRLSASGTSYTQLVHELRFGLATKLLENPHVPIASIASKAGFAGPTGLSRAFSAWTGMPPSEYRSQLLTRSVRGTRTSRDTYKYNFKVGNKIVHSGITINLERRERHHQQRWPNGHIKQVGYRTTADAARNGKRPSRRKENLH